MRYLFTSTYFNRTKHFWLHIRGNIWLPSGDLFNLGQSADYFNHEFIIHAYNTDKQQWIDLDVKPVSDTGNFNFYSPKRTT